MTPEQSSVSDVGKHDAFLKPFAGVFTLAEPIAAVRERVHRAIDDSISGLSWAVRTVGRPLLRKAAHIPEWVRFEGTAAKFSVGFSGGIFAGDIVLSSPLDGPRTKQRLVPGIAGEVLHLRVDDRTLRTDIFSDSGMITNEYRLLDDVVLEGRVTMISDELPKSIQYGMRLRRAR